MSLQAPFQTSFKHHFNAVQASFFGEEHRFGVVSGNGSSAGASLGIVKESVVPTLFWHRCRRRTETPFWRHSSVENAI